MGFPGCGAWEPENIFYACSICFISAGQPILLFLAFGNTARSISRTSPAYALHPGGFQVWDQQNALEFYVFIVDIY